MLTEKQLGRIFSDLEKYNLTPDAEITIECNPEDFTQDFANSVKAIGFNRISLGVQSFDKNELISLGRAHTPEMAENAVIIAKNHFDNVSIDLMLGTPAQTEDSLELSLSKCKALQPNHISAYLMKVYENTVFGKKGINEASDELSEKLYLKTSDFLKKIGYEHYEISSFSLDGKYSRHNMLYWTGGEYIAFGAGACGYEKGVRYRYPGNAEAFAAQKGRTPFIIEEEETTSSLKEENLIFGLRTSKGIHLDGLTKESIEYVNMLCKNGFAEISDNIFRLTPRGWLISNEIITELLTKEGA